MALMSTRGAGSARNYGTLSKRTQIFRGTPQQDTYTTPGTYTWVCPAGVTSVCVLCIGGGGGGGTAQFSTGGGGGGGVAMSNDITVTPGVSYTVVVAPGMAPNALFGARVHSTFNSTTVRGGTGLSGGIDSGEGGAPGGGDINPRSIGQIQLHGGDGGDSGSSNHHGGGGGAGGRGINPVAFSESGKGGSAIGGYFGTPPDGNDGVLGGAGGGASSTLTITNGAGGGGIGVFGIDTVFGNGGGGQRTNNVPYGGYGGSGGETGQTATASAAGTGGRFGGGGGGGPNAAPGAGGAVRIIWGAGRAYPNTNTGDVYV